MSCTETMDLWQRYMLEAICLELRAGHVVEGKQTTEIPNYGLGCRHSTRYMYMYITACTCTLLHVHVHVHVPCHRVVMRAVAIQLVVQ